MDVSRPIQFFVIALGFTILTGCKDQEINTVHHDTKKCSESKIEGQYIVRWKDGRVTTVHADNREAFIEETLEPNIDDIEFSQQDQLIKIGEPISSSYDQLQPMEIANWGAEDTNADIAWAKGVRGEGVIVAVIDSGVDYSHPQLKSQILYNPGEDGLDASGRDKATNRIDDDGNGFVDDYAGYDFFNRGALVPGPNRVSDHGTHVAGIIAAQHSDTEIYNDRVQGVAPDSKILPLKFIGPNGGSLSDALKAIDYAVSRGAKIINASWGGLACSELLGEKIKTLSHQGILFVSAAGNNGSDIDKNFEFPASFNMPSQITVGSVTPNGIMASHSNFGDVNVHIFAPGVDILSTVSGQRQAEMTGTSMATPFVTGAAALLMSARPDAPIALIREALINSVITDSYYRNASRGRLNIGDALAYVLSH